MFSGMPSHSMQGQNGLVQGRQMMPPNFQQGMMPMGQQSFMPAANPMLFGARQPVKRVVNKRRGKWTLEEEVYANKLIEAFKTGAIEDCEDGSSPCSFRGLEHYKTIFNENHEIKCARVRFGRLGQCLWDYPKRESRL